MNRICPGDGWDTFLFRKSRRWKVRSQRCQCVDFCPATVEGPPWCTNLIYTSICTNGLHSSVESNECRANPWDSDSTDHSPLSSKKRDTEEETPEAQKKLKKWQETSSHLTSPSNLFFSEAGDGPGNHAADRVRPFLQFGPSSVSHG